MEFDGVSQPPLMDPLIQLRDRTGLVLKTLSDIEAEINDCLVFLVTTFKVGIVCNLRNQPSEPVEVELSVGLDSRKCRDPQGIRSELLVRSEPVPIPITSNNFVNTWALTGRQTGVQHTTDNIPHQTQR